ncbi:MAG: DUF1585 domain-containing protein, partial [Lentisphaeraceae bacterium]|nr:DUF1585 domain-containing protein [Lentisphaeraceae bacterium]
LFETLGPLGEERTLYAQSSELKGNKVKKAPVDISALNFKGHTFQNLNDFKKYIRENAKDTIVKSYMYKLVMYTFGRGKDFTDKFKITKILDANKSNFKAKDLLIEFICSSAFTK